MVVKSSSNKKSSSKGSSSDLKAAKKADSKSKRSSAETVSKKQKGKAEESDDLEAGAVMDIEDSEKKTTRAEDEVVTYDEIAFELKEVIPEGNQILIGPPRLTRFERARITGARSLQLSLGAPSLIQVPKDIRDSISLAIAELDLKALPISIRRILPNGLYQDIPIQWMK